MNFTEGNILIYCTMCRPIAKSEIWRQVNIFGWTGHNVSQIMHYIICQVSLTSKTVIEMLSELDQDGNLSSVSIIVGAEKPVQSKSETICEDTFLL